MRNHIGILCILFSLVFLVTALNAVQTGEIKKVLSYKFIPYEEFGKILDKPGSRYIGIKLKEFYELFKKADALSAEKEILPKWTISKIKLNCNVHKDIVFINIKYNISTFEDWQKVPLVEKSFCPIYVKVNENSDEKLLYDQGFAELILEKKGEYTVELFGGVPTAEEKVYVKERKFGLEFPNAPIVSGNISVEKSTTVEIEDSILNRVNDYSYTFHLKGTSRLKAKWADYLEDETFVAAPEKEDSKPPVPDNSVKEPRKLRIHSKIFRLFILHADRMNEYTYVNLNESKGLNRFAMEIPGDMEIISVRSQKKFEKFIEEKEGKQILNIQYENQIKDDFLFIKFSRKLSDTVDRLSITDIKPLNVITDHGYLAFVSLINQEFLVQNAEKLFEIDDKELPYNINTITSLPMIASYKYNSHPYSLNVEIKKVFNVETTKNSVVNDLWYNTIVTRKGEFFTSAKYHIHTNIGEPMKIRFSDPATKIFSCFVNDQAVRPSRTAESGEYIISYPNKEWKKSRYKIELVYLYNTRTLGRMGRMQVQYPAINMDILKKNYSIYLPEKYHIYGWDDLQLQQDESTYKKSSFLAVPLAIREYFMGEMGEMWYVWLFFAYFMVIIAYRYLKVRIQQAREKSAEVIEEEVTVQKSRGMSCLSLLIIMITLGILAAISVPNFNSARKQARGKACVANIKMLENALEMYDMDHPPGDDRYTTVVMGYGENVKQYGLTDGGYVQRWPQCPVSGVCDYTVGRSGGVENYAIYVRCRIHGTLDGPGSDKGRQPGAAPAPPREVAQDFDQYAAKAEQYAPQKQQVMKDEIQLERNNIVQKVEKKRLTKKGSLPIPIKMETKGKRNNFYSLFHPKNQPEFIMMKYMDNRFYWILSSVVFLLTLVFLYFSYRHKISPSPAKLGIVLMAFLGLFIMLFYIGILENMIFYAFSVVLLIVLVKYCWNSLEPYIKKSPVSVLVLILLSCSLMSAQENVNYRGKGGMPMASKSAPKVFYQNPEVRTDKTVPAPPDSLPIDLFIPYKETANFLKENFTEETVFLNYYVFSDMMHRVWLDENRTEEFFRDYPCCVGAINTEIQFEKKVLNRKDIVNVKVVMRGNLYIFKEDAQVFLPGGLKTGYQSVKLNGKKVPILNDGSGYYIVAHEKGRQEFEIKYYDSFAWSDGDGSYEVLTFDNASFSKSITVEFVNFSRLSPEVEKGIIMKKFEDAENGRFGFQAYCALWNSNGTERISWKQSRIVEKSQEQDVKIVKQKLTQKIKIRNFNNVEISDNLVNLYTSLELNIENEGLSELLLSVQDKEYKIISLEGNYIHHWNQDDNGEVRISFQNPVLGKYILDIRSQKVFDISKEAVWSGKVPFIIDQIKDNVLKRKFFIGIETSPDMEFETEDVASVSELGYGDIPEELKAMVQQGLIRNYYFEDRICQIPFKITKTQSVEMEPININNMEITSYILDQGTEMRTVCFTIQNNSKQFLKVDLIPGTSVWSVWNDDGTINPYYRTEKEKAIYIPLKKSRMDNQNLIAYKLWVAMMVEKQKTTSWFNVIFERTLNTPGVDATINKTRWNVYTLKNMPITGYWSDSFTEYSTENVESIGIESPGRAPFNPGQSDLHATRLIFDWYQQIMAEEKNYSKLPIPVKFSFFEGFTVSVEQNLNQQGSSESISIYLLNSRLKKIVTIFVFLLGVLLSPFLVKILKLEFDRLSISVAVIAAVVYRVVEIYNTYVYDHFVAGIIFGFLMILLMNIVNRVFNRPPEQEKTAEMTGSTEQ